jgi:hypothetical protein
MKITRVNDDIFLGDFFLFKIEDHTLFLLSFHDLLKYRDVENVSQVKIGSYGTRDDLEEFAKIWSNYRQKNNYNITVNDFQKEIVEYINGKNIDENLLNILNKQEEIYDNESEYTKFKGFRKSR